MSPRSCRLRVFEESRKNGMTCNDCIWVNVCDEFELCDDFTATGNTDECAYVNDLNERHAAYMALVLEYD